MIIIVEGIDKAGKTTLCNMISEELHIPIHKYKGIIPYNKMKNAEETDKTLGLIQLLQETNSDIIFDRAYLSDYVYGIIERQYDPCEAFMNFITIDSILSKIDNVFLIYVLPVDIKYNNRQHGSDLSKHDELFYSVFKESKIKNKHRCTYHSLNETINYIIANKEK